MQVFTSAPGKLVVLGEYAVLHGAPALIMAINRRAEVRVTPVAKGLNRVDSLGSGIESAHFMFDGGIRWHHASRQTQERMQLVTHIMQFFANNENCQRLYFPTFHVRLDTSGFFSPSECGRSKLGLGSSAALTIALASALVIFGGAEEALTDRHTWLARVLVLYKNFQDGSGSGLDLAASLYGNVIRYALSSSRGAPDVRFINLPRGIHTVFIWPGQPTSTPQFLKRLHSWRLQQPGQYDSVMQELAAIADMGIVAVEEDNAAAFVDTVKLYSAALKRFGEESAVEIFSSEHRHIEKLVASLGAAYKPCGAGGGDIGMAITMDPEVASLLSKRIARAGYQVVPLQVDKVGLKTQTITE